MSWVAEDIVTARGGKGEGEAGIMWKRCVDGDPLSP
jgi:hypothetical protein